MCIHINLHTHFVAIVVQQSETTTLHLALHHPDSLSVLASLQSTTNGNRQQLYKLFFFPQKTSDSYHKYLVVGGHWKVLENKQSKQLHCWSVQWYVCYDVILYSGKFSLVQIFAKILFPLQKKFCGLNFHVQRQCELLTTPLYHRRAYRGQKISGERRQDVVCWFEIVMQHHCQIE